MRGGSYKPNKSRWIRQWVIWPILPQCYSTLFRGFDARLANRTFLVLTFGHSGAQGWALYCPKVKKLEMVA